MTASITDRLTARLAGLAAAPAAAFLLALAPLPTASAQMGGMPANDAEPVRFDLSLQPGQTLSYTILTDLQLEQKAGEEAMPKQRVQFALDADFTVREVQADGSAVIALDFSAGQVAVTDGDAAKGFAFGRRIGGGLGETIVQTPELASLAEALDKLEITIALDKDRTITAVGGVDAYAAAVAALPDADPRLVWLLTDRQLAEVLGPMFNAEGATAAPRAIGAGWQTTRSIPVPPAAVFDLTDEWVLQGVPRGLALIQGKTSYEVRRPTTPDATRPNVAIDDARGNIVLQWNLDEDRLERRVSTQNLTTTWTLGDLPPLQQTQRSMMVIEYRSPDA